MMVRNPRALALMTLCMALFQASARADEGRVNRATLDSMGLAGLRVMSDSEGLAVRGFGYNSSSAKAYGVSKAAISGHGGSAESTNGYLAQGSHFAAGENFSFAAIKVSSGGHGDNHGDGGYDNKSNGGNHGGGKGISVSVLSGGSSLGKTK